MKPITVLLLAFTLVLAGCGLIATQKQQAAARQAQAVREECEQKGLAGEFKSRVETVQCGSERIHQILFSAGYPHLDLFNLRAANDVVLARKVDSGELTLDEARLHSAEMQSRVVTEEQRRITVAQQMQQQNFKNLLNILNYHLQQQQNRAALMAPQPIVPVTCQQFGTVDRCY